MTTLMRSLIAVILLLAVLPASANPFAGDEPKASVELLVAADVVRPGDTIAVGIKFTMQPGWHIYWQNPGDAGQPPTFSWNLPKGFEAIEPNFPTPISFESGGLVGYGYGDTIIFPATLTVPKNLMSRGGGLTMAVDYLICDDKVCIPESAVATADVTLGGSTEIKQNVVDAIEAAKASVPIPVQRKDDTGDLQVTLRGVTNVGLFPMPPGDVEATPGAVTQSSDIYTLPLKTRKLGGGDVPTFPAVIGYTDSDGNRRGLLVTITPAGAAGAAE